MHTLPGLPIAGIGFGEIVWVIIALVVVIVRIIRSRRETVVPPQSPHSPGQPRAPQSDPQAELQRFLRALAGEEEPVQVRPPQPPPPPQQARRVQRAPRPTPVPVATPAMATAPLSKVGEASAEPATAGVGITDLAAGNTAGAARLRANLLRDLRQPQALRKGILLREILGPPVAMRESGRSR